MSRISASLKATLRFDKDKVRKLVAAALYQHAERVMAVSKLRVPVDTGALMSTGHVRLPVVAGDTIKVSLGYGGPSVGYALVVHENLDPRVHWSRPGSGPKYLENPFHELQNDLAPAVAAALKEGMTK